MPDLDDTQASDQDQQLSLTGDDLAALHGVARQLQAAGDPRAQKLWNFIGAYSGDGSAKPAYTLRQSPPKTTNWQDDLETELWGDAAGGDQPAVRTNATVDDEDDSQPAADGTGATADFLDDLSGIGLHAYLAMRDPDLPAYKDWRNGYFVRDGSNYVSREGEAYTNDELKQAHQVLSHQAGNPLISNMFIGPKFQTADYLVWRNQNFSDDGGPWQDDEGNIYSEPALQEMFGAKFATDSAGPGSQASTEDVGESGDDGQPERVSDSEQDYSAYDEPREQSAEESGDEDAIAGPVQDAQQGHGKARPGRQQAASPQAVASQATQTPGGQFAGPTENPTFFLKPAEPPKPPEPSWTEIREYIAQEARAYGVPVKLAEAVAKHESNFDIHLHTPVYRNKGENPVSQDIGLMQVNSSNTGTLGGPEGWTFKVDPKRVENDWKYNVHVGMAILRNAYQGARVNTIGEENIARETYARYNAPGTWRQLYAVPGGVVNQHVNQFMKSWRYYYDEKQ